MTRPIGAWLCLGALTASTLLLGSAHSSILVAGQSLTVGSQQHSSKPRNPAYNISLNEAKAGFAAINYQTIEEVDGPSFTAAFTEAIQGYRFVMADRANAISTVASKGVSISMSTMGNAFDFGNAAVANIWITSNPGADLKEPATSRDFAAGLRRVRNIGGSIDISGLASGTVYFFYGGYRCQPSITACMTDVDGPKPSILVFDFHNGDSADGSERYMSSLTFVNDAGYDTIEYDFSAPNGNWDGIVVTGKAKP